MKKTKRKSELDLAVGQALKHFRSAVGLTQSEAAEALSTTQATLSNYENGITSVTPTTLHAAFSTYKATPNEFFAATEEQLANARSVLRGAKPPIHDRSTKRGGT